MAEVLKTFWAYRHINGNIFVRSYRLPESRRAIDDAFESEFTDDVLDPFAARNRGEAEQIARAKFSKLPRCVFREDRK